MRVIIAGLIGGVVMFLWAAVAHMATPLAVAGLKRLPAEAATVASLRAAIGDTSGLYFFPFKEGDDARAMADQRAKMQLGPTGLLAYQAPGSPALMPGRLGVELGLEILESLLAAAVIAAAPGLARRLGVVVAIGMIAAVSTNFSYWNWYGFSWEYTLAQAIMELMKYVLAGVAIIAVLAWRGRRSRGLA